MGADRSDRAAAPGAPVAPLRVGEIAIDLRTERLGSRIHYFSEIASTNLHARRLAECGRGEGEIVIAEQQTRGRGRLGRSWFSPPYRNLYLSVILRPRLAPRQAPQITLMAAVAVADAVARFTAPAPAIKWPNDILVGGKKLAGILTESYCVSDRIDFVILGIGVNLNYPRDLMPEAIQDQATSIMILNERAVEREAFAKRLIQDLDRCYGELQVSGFGAIAARWQERFSLRGKRVRVQMLNETWLGTAECIDSQGALLLRDKSGTMQRVLAGDVVPIDDPEPA